MSLYEGLCVSADLHVLFNKLNQSVIRDVGKWRDTKKLISLTHEHYLQDIIFAQLSNKIANHSKIEASIWL